MKVSFDFDSTLTRPNVQEYAKELVDAGHEAWIVTSRWPASSALEFGWYWVEDENLEVYRIADYCGIPHDQIVFTEHIDKATYLKGKGFLFHLDDNLDELLNIKNSGDPCIPINSFYFAWKEECDVLLK